MSNSSSKQLDPFVKNSVISLHLLVCLPQNTLHDKVEKSIAREVNALYETSHGIKMFGDVHFCLDGVTSFA